MLHFRYIIMHYNYTELGCGGVLLRLTSVTEMIWQHASTNESVGSGGDERRGSGRVWVSKSQRGWKGWNEIYRIISAPYLTLLLKSETIKTCQNLGHLLSFEKLPSCRVKHSFYRRFLISPPTTYCTSCPHVGMSCTLVALKVHNT